MPSFNEWVEYVFTHLRDDHYGDWERSLDREGRFIFIDENILAGYITELCSNIQLISDQFDAVGVYRGINALIGIGSEAAQVVFDHPEVARHEGRAFRAATFENRIALIRSLETLYVELIDAGCMGTFDCMSPNLRDMYKGLASFILHWDLGPLFQWSGEEHDPLYREVAEAIALRCQSDECIKAGLFALATLRGSAEFDRILETRDLSDELTEFARLGREGRLPGLP